ncbi:MAG: FdhF/YdeP family oxidoreductase [Acidobacteria bacterium]|nr:FdhF/YdeP family oxidoreductase [Acidobacteriota bacterium]
MAESKTHSPRSSVAGLVPFGLGQKKPHHYRDMLRVAWDNRDNWRYAYRILHHGVCDGCSLGPYGLKDSAVSGVHLCMSRLKMLRLNTMPALDVALMSDISRLRQMTGSQLRKLGRLPYPMLYQKGDKGFRRIGWDEALRLAGDALRAADPKRVAFYTTSRGLTNEVYYVAQKLARLLGTNHIDNAARLCHAASTVALKQMLGVGASTCSYKDWIGTDLIVLIGTNLAANQPVATKYLHYAKQRGARIVVVNPYREPGLERYWVPSITKSALFGTRLMDDFFAVRPGGDVAFLNGVLKCLIERDWLDRSFIEEHTNGFAELRAQLQTQDWPMLEQASGLPKTEIVRFAEIYSRVNNAVFIWSMGLTQQRHGVDNVRAVVNVALARGMIGRQNCGVVPIRGHSGVQGGGECGSVPGEFPGGLPVNAHNAHRFEQLWGHPVPAWKGMNASQMLNAAHAGQLDVFYIVGGNFLETMPVPSFMEEALRRVRVRIHQELILNTSALVEPGEALLLLPAQTRYEQRGGGTVTSTERRIRFTPEIPGPRIGETKAEWEILSLVGQRALPEPARALIRYAGVRQIMEEMDRAMPLYQGIQDLRQEGDSFQYGGPLLLQGGVCPKMPDGRARFLALRPVHAGWSQDLFYLTTRRGDQFNSIVYSDKDPITGSKRRDLIFFSPDDAQRLHLADGDTVLLQSEHGQLQGICAVERVRTGCLQAFWPEANVLLDHVLDPESGEPDYNVLVSVKKFAPP